MIFSELYGAYYTTMARIIERAIDHPLERGEMRKIIEENAFGESAFAFCTFQKAGGENRGRKISCQHYIRA